jgi:serine/threonine-protein kinase
MSHKSLELLLDRWSEAHEKGREISVAELCRNRPELVALLKERIEGLRHVNGLLEQMAFCPAATLHEAGQTLAPEPVSPLAQSIPDVPGYKIIRELGKGGVGIVFLARDIYLDRLVALKMLRDPLQAGALGVARFRGEARMIARLAHPGTAQIHEIGDIAAGPQMYPYLSMEYCAGGSLADRLAGRPLPADEAASLVEQLARTMDEIHEAGVIHRDLKPGNVLLSCSRDAQRIASDALRSEDSASRLHGCVPKITDFGLARWLVDDDAIPSGMVIGTPSYMPPEQALGRGDLAGPAADVWSLGAILYECLTGQPPFLGGSVIDTLQQVIRRDPVSPRLHNSKCPARLEYIALKCLRKDPNRRYASAAALADDLEHFRTRRRKCSRHGGRLTRLVRRMCRCPFPAAWTAAAIGAAVAALAG